MRSVYAIGLLVAVGALAACDELFDIHVVHRPEDAGAAPDASPIDDAMAEGGGNDAMVDASAPDDAFEAPDDSSTVACPDAAANCDGGCVNLSTSEQNCGSCGTPCPGVCQAGACLVVLAVSRASPLGVIVDETNVYWGDIRGAYLLSEPLAGGGITTLASGTPFWFASSLVSDLSNVYWLAEDVAFPHVSLMSVAGRGGTPVRLLTSPDELGGIARDGHTLYLSDTTAGVLDAFPLVGRPTVVAAGDSGAPAWGASVAVSATTAYWLDGQSNLVAASLAGGTPFTLATNPSGPLGPGFLDDPAEIALDMANVYWRSPNGTVLSIPQSPDAGNGSPATLASGHTGQALAIDDTSIYFTDRNQGQILRAPLSGVPIGSTPSTLASGQEIPDGIAVRGGLVYWTTYSNVMSAPIDGGAPVTLAATEATENTLNVDETSVYWATGLGESVMAAPTVPVAGQGPTVLAASQGQGIVGLTIDQSNAYWTDNSSGSIMQVPLKGGTPTALVTALDEPTGIAVLPGPAAGGPTTLYWRDLPSSPAGFYSCISALPLGGPLVTLASGQASINNIAAKSGGIYADGFYTGTVIELSEDGGTPQTIATGEQIQKSSPVDSTIVMDDANVYWIASGIMKASRAGGPALTLVSGGATPPWAIATDGVNVYFSENANGDLVKIPVGGGAITTLFAGTENQGARSIAVDATSVYWTTEGICGTSEAPACGIVYRLTPK